MKKSIVIIALLTLVSGTIITSCMTPAQKVTSAKKNVEDAKEDLDKANKE